MPKEKGSNPLQDWRRKEKEKATKAKRKAREEKLAEIPAHKRDPAPLVSEIYRLSVLEYEGRLNSDTKQHKKRLFDQYQSIKKARNAADLETVELVEFDPEAHEAAKLRQLQSKRHKGEAATAAIKNIHLEQAQKQEIHFDLDERGFPKLPDGPSPLEEELLSSLGLPAYSPFPYEPVEESEEPENLSALEAQLEAEYELFKEALDE